jgi:hypothetical protein
MKFRVFWAPLAEEQLERILATATDKNECVASAKTLDKALATDPLELGESRYDSVRVGFALPLGIQFEVLADIETVVVYSVWQIE